MSDSVNADSEALRRFFKSGALHGTSFRSQVAYPQFIFRVPLPKARDAKTERYDPSDLERLDRASSVLEDDTFQEFSENSIWPAAGSVDRHLS